MSVTLSPENARRVTKLRERMLGERDICIERAKYYTESYRETEGEPVPIRRAKALYHILDNLTLHIEPGELIVGCPTSKTRGRALCPEISPTPLMDRDDPSMLHGALGVMPVPREVWQEVQQIDAYWKGKDLKSIHDAMIPEEYNTYSNRIIWGNETTGLGCMHMGHESMAFELLLRGGAKGRIAEIDEAIAALCIDRADYFHRLNNLKGMRIALEAIVNFARRYSDYARELAAEETDEERRKELLEISRICAKVPWEPAETFHEALQVLWFCYCTLVNESYGNSIGFMRFDQVMYPYYKADRESGRADDERILLLTALSLIKLNETVSGLASHSMGCNVTIGGVIPATGECAVNELSWLMLDAEELVCLSNDDVIVRVGENTPDDFLMRSVEAARNMSGKLKFLGDKTVISQMLHDGRPLEYARDYCIVGCTSPTIPGRSLDLPGGVISMPMMLDLALHDGYSVMMRKQLGPHSGDAREFKSYEEVMAAFEVQCRHFFPIFRMMNNLDKELTGQYLPNTFQSTLMYECVPRGLDVREGGTAPYVVFAMSMGGVPNVGDSLAAVKRLVFEQKMLSMRELIDALDRNFEGDDKLLRAINRVPKYGNNDDYVDGIVNDVLRLGCRIAEESECYAGAVPTMAGTVVSANVDLGFYVGALPDGRRAGEAIAEGGISPYQGRNVNGMTATALSAAKLDHMTMRHGSVLNMLIDPEVLQGEVKLRKFSDMIKVYFAMGGYLIQFNIVSADTLRDAQIHPENHKDLVVRVATYAAFFTELQKDLQDDIIRRMEFKSL